MICFVSSFFGIIESFFIPPSFWKNHINIAKYNLEVKGDNEESIIEEIGLSGSAKAREQFGGLFKKRATSIYGDPISFSFANVLPIVYLFIVFNSRKKKKIIELFLFFIASSAEILSFTRSAWILIFASIFAYLISHRKMKLLFLCSIIILFFLYFFKGILEFIYLTITLQIDSMHLMGILGYFQNVLFNPYFLLGKGINPYNQIIGESGFSFIHCQLGIMGLIIFFLLIFLCNKRLNRMIELFRRDDLEIWALVTTIKYILIFTPLTMLFYQTAFSFIPYFTIWLTTGFLLKYDKDLLKQRRIKLHESSHSTKYLSPLSYSII